MEKLLKKIRQDFPTVSLIPGNMHCWSPADREVFYDNESGQEGLWGLLHELGHARLNHSSYSSDIELLLKEVLAWEEARKLGDLYGVNVERSYIEDCLDTYREWLYKRSTCPRCSLNGLQTTAKLYYCIGCGNRWQVTPSRFGRPYRRSEA